MPTDRTDTTSPAEPDTTERPVYRVTMPSGFPWADRELTIPAPASADDIAMVVHTELTEVGYAAGTLDVDVELSTGTVRVSYQGWASTDGTISGPGVGTPATPDTTPDLTAVVALLRKLIAAGWEVDYAYPYSDGSVCRGLIHPTGREVQVRIYRDRTVGLSLSDLTFEQAVGAVTGAGLAPDAESSPGLLAAVSDIIEAYQLDWHSGVDVEAAQGRAHSALLAAYQAHQGGTR
ncbi:hypothetical protein ACIBCR_16560 [Micromonospora echinospora]|uniref:hypothetical protein n=1 Tax=Micromonospora echinospora TaxID=1877 RepID=UPI00379F259E